MTDYTAWLIEINEPVSGPLYYQLKDDNDWTVDQDVALHLGRKDDAQRIIDYYGWTRANPVEHMWPEATSCSVCGGDCSAANPPVLNCPNQDYGHLGEDGDQSGSHTGYLRHKDNWSSVAIQPIKPVAWRVKNDYGHWVSTTDKALADTWIRIEKFAVEPLFLGVAQGSPDHIEIKRLSGLLADAQRISAEYKASTTAAAKADVAAHGLPGARDQRQPDLAAENKKLIDALRTIVSEYGPDHGSRYCFRIAVDVLKDVAAARTSQVTSTHCPPLNKKSRCPACNLLNACSEPGCPNALSSTPHGDAT